VTPSQLRLDQFTGDLLTPVERRDVYWLKRDDLFEFAGMSGGKVRACVSIAAAAPQGLVTASARTSPQAAIVAAVAQSFRLPARVHTAWGGQTPSLAAAQGLNAEIVAHRPGYNSVIVRRAIDDAQASGWTLVPFGMECAAAVAAAAHQCLNMPEGVARLVVPVGSGMTLIGVLQGLRNAGRNIPVLGVVVGAAPERRLDQWAPVGWSHTVSLVRPAERYAARAATSVFQGVALSANYEAKCIPFLQPEDCLWLVGNGASTPAK
jgi:1-aminocyclopropane-1-carboxylate deaminase/D-cysteine desulfhydrase-like pyridoxal-dependent ACC family enzyme